MKFSTIFFFDSTSADHYSEDYYKFSNEYIAIIGLNHLEKVSSEIFSIESIKKSSSWKHKWTRKFRLNSDRMRKSFERCGTGLNDVEQLHYEEIDMQYDSNHLCQTMKKLTTKFSKWTNRYISSCQGQKKKSHQQNRMKRWNDMLNKGIGFSFFIIRNLDYTCNNFYLNAYFLC